MPLYQVIEPTEDLKKQANAVSIPADIPELESLRDFEYPKEKPSPKEQVWARVPTREKRMELFAFPWTIEDFSGFIDCIKVKVRTATEFQCYC